MTDDVVRWQARHFDGETPTPRNVIVRLQPDTLIVSGDAMEERWWPLGSVVIVNRGSRVDPVQLELRGERTESLVVTGFGFLAALHAAGGGRKMKRLDAQAVALRVILGLIILAAVVLFATWRWGVPALAAVMTERFPSSWERELGVIVLQGLPLEKYEVKDALVLRPAGDAFNRLLEAAPPSAHSYQVHVIRSADVNAYAVPGGHVLVTTALLRSLDAPDELAAVLAHEITHLTLRHTTRGMLEQEGLRLVFRLMSGDGSGVGSLIGKAGELGGLSYSRDDETEADAGAAELLARAGISPLALARVHDRLSALDSTGPGLEFLSTHPANAARRERARELAKVLVVAPVAPLDTASWRSMDEMFARKPSLMGSP